MTTKHRLRFTRRGWFTHWVTLYPEGFECLEREFWVGPFDDADAAMRGVTIG